MADANDIVIADAGDETVVAVDSSAMCSVDATWPLAAKTECYCCWRPQTVDTRTNTMRSVLVEFVRFVVRPGLDTIVQLAIDDLSSRRVDSNSLTAIDLQCCIEDMTNLPLFSCFESNCI